MNSREVLAVPDLRHVRLQRGDLVVERVGDVDPAVQLRAAHDPQLVHRPGVQALVERAASRCANGLRASGYTAWIVASPAAMWSGCEAGSRSQLRSGDWQSSRCGRTCADHPADVAAQVEGDDQLAVGVAEEPHVVDADRLGGRASARPAGSPGSATRGTSGSKPPASPFGDDRVRDLRRRRWSSAAIVPAAPKSTSSGCAVTTRTRSGRSGVVGTVSLGVVSPGTVARSYGRPRRLDSAAR